MPTTAKEIEGWVYPNYDCRKRHYIRKGRSLCGKWGVLGLKEADIHHDYRKDCRECLKKLLPY